MVPAPVERQAAYAENQQCSGVNDYNCGARDVPSSLEAGKKGSLAVIAAGVGTDWATYTRPDDSDLMLVEVGKGIGVNGP
jgi:hypothetical protein